MASRSTTTSTITMDAGGRVVIPKRVRQALRLHPGSHLRLLERERSMVLEPIEEDPLVVERDGLILIGGRLEGPSAAVRELREEGLEELTRRITNPDK